MHFHSQLFAEFFGNQTEPFLIKKTHQIIAIYLLLQDLSKAVCREESSEDLCYEILLAAAFVDESDLHAL